MIRHYTEKEMQDRLSKLAIITDTREQINDHITQYLDKKGIKQIKRKLDVGDYSCQIDDLTFEKSFVVERKRNLDELCGNMTADRDRFEREFLRAKANNIKVFLIVENASWEDVFLQNYRSKLSSKALLGSLLAWQTRYNISIIFCKNQNTAKMIHGILYYAAKEELVNGIL